MYSVLEFLKNTEPLLQYENRTDDMYVAPCVTRLKQSRERLRDYFYNHSDDVEGLNNLFLQCNSNALQLELHLSRTEDEFLTMREKRSEAESIYKQISMLIRDASETNRLSEREVIELAQISSFVKHYYLDSKFYIWNTTDKDKQKLKQAKSFMEVYNGNHTYT